MKPQGIESLFRAMRHWRRVTSDAFTGSVLPVAHHRVWDTTSTTRPFSEAKKHYTVSETAIFLSVSGHLASTIERGEVHDV